MTGPRTYEVRLRRPADRTLGALPLRTRRQLLRAITALGNDPRPSGARKLTGADLWRIRIGDYRAIYEIRDAVLLVLVIKLGHRSDVYRTR